MCVQTPLEPAQLRVQVSLCRSFRTGWFAAAKPHEGPNKHVACLTSVSLRFTLLSVDLPAPNTPASLSTGLYLPSSQPGFKMCASETHIQIVGEALL